VNIGIGKFLRDGPTQASIEGAFRRVTAAVSAGFQREHREDGTHTDITADGLTISSDVAQVTVASHDSTFTTASPDVTSGASVTATGPGGLSIAATHASGALRFYAGGSSQRFGVSAGGDMTIGTTPNVFVNTATPSVTAGGGTGAQVLRGNNSAFLIGTGSTASTTVTVTFGGAGFSDIPICQVTPAAAGADPYISAVNSTTITITYVSATNLGLHVTCLGY
jgi:hypothetical protein